MTETVAGYKVVTLCGSMRFYTWMLEVAEQETLEGRIVLMPFVRKDEHMTARSLSIQDRIVAYGLEGDESLATRLDVMHKAKIDMSDEIIVCTDSEGYYGESTTSEIEYAIQKFKGISFAKQPEVEQPF